MPHNEMNLASLYFGDGIEAEINESDVTVNGATIQLVTYNARRVALTLVNTGGSNVTIDFNPPVVLGQGISLPPGSMLEFNWFEDTALVTRQLFANAPFANNPIHIIETVLTGYATTG